MDYKTIGCPEKDINCPIGCDELYRFPKSMEYIQYYQVFCEVFDLKESFGEKEVNKDSVAIEIYNKENCYGTPHIQVYYQKKSINISLVDGKIISGNIPQRNKEIAVKWVIDNLEMLKDS